MARRRAASAPTVEYRDSILDETGEICPDTSIMRYKYDEWNYIEVHQSERGVEIRSVGAEMLINPLSGNNVEIFLRDRR